MTHFQAIILGLIQGLTEFLPVSSSGHLGLATHLMNISDPGFTFEIVVHVGTLLSVIVYFHRQLWQLCLSLFNKAMVEERRMIGYLFLATIPAGVAGFTLKKYFDAANENPAIISLLLLLTGTILLLPRIFSSRLGKAPVRLPSAMIMGLGQAVAIFPGISRSGSTIVAGMLSGTNSSQAAEFSFLLAIPAIAGAALKTFLFDLEPTDSSLMSTYVIGGVVAFVSGLLAVYAVLALVRRGKFEYFAYYCFVVGVAGFCYFHFFRSA